MRRPARPAGVAAPTRPAVLPLVLLHRGRRSPGRGPPDRLVPPPPRRPGPPFRHAARGKRRRRPGPEPFRPRDRRTMARLDRSTPPHHRHRRPFPRPAQRMGPAQHCRVRGRLPPQNPAVARRSPALVTAQPSPPHSRRPGRPRQRAQTRRDAAQSGLAGRPSGASRDVPHPVSARRAESDLQHGASVGCDCGGSGAHGCSGPERSKHPTGACVDRHASGRDGRVAGFAVGGFGG
jgi:hypothetical protein